MEGLVRIADSNSFESTYDSTEEKTITERKNNKYKHRCTHLDDSVRYDGHTDSER
jgi:hypothetical protein